MPAREALKRSESEGPVESVPNRDPCVALGTAGAPHGA